MLTGPIQEFQWSYFSWNFPVCFSETCLTFKAKLYFAKGTFLHWVSISFRLCSYFSAAYICIHLLLLWHAPSGYQGEDDHNEYLPWQSHAEAIQPEWGWGWRLLAGSLYEECKNKGKHYGKQTSVDDVRPCKVCDDKRIPLSFVTVRSVDSNLMLSSALAFLFEVDGNCRAGDYMIGVFLWKCIFFNGKGL